MREVRIPLKRCKRPLIRQRERGRERDSGRERERGRERGGGSIILEERGREVWKGTKI